MSLRKDAKIYVAGHGGLAGSAILRAFESAGYGNLLVRSHSECDLADPKATEALFREQRPDYVVLAAAKVGGIAANDEHPAEFIRENLYIQTNVVDSAWRNGARRLLFLGSSCIYPRDCSQPIKEDYLLTGPLEATNRAYAVAKIAGVEMCWAYNRQHGTRFLGLMPTNLYGPNDKYDLENSHVLPALLRKMHEAKVRGHDKVVVWGTGKPRREFLHSDDLGAAAVFLMELPDATFDALTSPGTAPLINVGFGKEIPVAELAQTIAGVVGFEGRLEFDASRPDGTPRKLLDVTRLSGLGWRASIDLADGLARTYREFLARCG